MVMLMSFVHFDIVMKLMAFIGKHNNYQWSKVYKKEVKINEIFVSNIAGYGSFFCHFNSRKIKF